MKRPAIAVTLVSALLFSMLIGVQFINKVKADTLGPDFTPLLVTVTSPIKNKVYNSNIELQVKITKPDVWFTSSSLSPLLPNNYYCQGKVNFIRYSIDGKTSVTIPANDSYTGYSKVPITPILYYELPLRGLSQGIHTLAVSAEGDYYYWVDVYNPAPHNTVVGNSAQIQFYVISDQYVWGGSVSPPEGAIPPKITIFSPNITVFTSNNVSLSFKAGLSRDASVITDVWYQVVRQSGNTSVYHLNNTSPANFFNDTLTGMADGNYMITVFANGVGDFVNENTYYVFEIVGSSSVNFTIDGILPKISFMSPQNKTYDTANVVLNFVVNKPVSQVFYSLDNHGNMTTNANASLSLLNLSDGKHNVTIYAQDEYGIISAPSTVYFDVKVFPLVTEIAVVLVVLVVIIGVGLLVYFKKRKRGAVQG